MALTLHLILMLCFRHHVPHRLLSLIAPLSLAPSHTDIDSVEEWLDIFTVKNILKFWLLVISPILCQERRLDAETRNVYNLPKVGQLLARVRHVIILNVVVKRLISSIGLLGKPLTRFLAHNSRIHNRTSLIV